MLILLLIWAAIGIAFMAVGRRQHSAGLPLAYFLGLSLAHVPGAMLYIGADNEDTAAFLTETGFAQTVIGMAAFLFAVVIARFAASLRRGTLLAGVGRLANSSSEGLAGL